MPNLEKPADPRENFAENEADIEQKKQEIAQALEAGDYASVAALAQEAKGMETARGEMVNEAHGEALEDNKVFDEAKAAEKAQKDAEIAEQARLQTEADAAEAAALLAKLQGGNVEGGVVAASSATAENQESKEALHSVQEVITKMKRIGYYKEEFAALQPGEFPSESLATRMISSAIDGLSEYSNTGYGFQPEDVKVLMENLPFDSKQVKEWTMKKVFEDLSVSGMNLKRLELSGAEPAQYHDEARKLVPHMLYLIAGDRGEIRLPEDMKQWRETFGISDEEYSEELHNYWKENNGKIADKHLSSLGFVKGGLSNPHPRWAWEQ